MSAKSYFSYVRVSTQRQGNMGTSLAQQQVAIENYAKRFNLRIVRQYEERETAAKTGRPVFLDMLRDLRSGKANGLIIHKIDRSARNLKDWANLGSLIDIGIEVHFANESLDLKSRGGRLSADIQAVVAADYIRNLREETKKGIYGRLRQGLYPFPARVGYLDAGKGKPKELDPIQAPLVKKAFELYASGNVGLNALVEKMYIFGLRNKNGKKISRNGLVCILKNLFYIGVIKMASIDELFIGVHEPIVSKALFDQVQSVFAGKRVRKAHRHFFTYRRIISCETCGSLLIGENQKGHVYYRCHTKSCPQKCIREDLVEKELLDIYKKLQLRDEEYRILNAEAANYQNQHQMKTEEVKKQLVMGLSQSQNRLAKLADAYVDGVFDKETYVLKQRELVLKQKEIKENLDSLDHQVDNIQTEFGEFLELLKTAYLSYNLANLEEKRDLVQITISNLSLEGKALSIKLKEPFQTVVERPTIPIGSPTLATTRTFRRLFKNLCRYFESKAISKNPVEELLLAP